MGSAPAPGAVSRAPAENIGRTEKLQVLGIPLAPKSWVFGLNRFRGRLKAELQTIWVRFSIRQVPKQGASGRIYWGKSKFAFGFVW